MDHSTSSSSSVPLLIIMGLFAWFYVARQRNQRSVEADLQALGAVRARVGITVALIADPWRISVLEAGQRETWPVTADTTVTVEMEGAITTTRGRNLATKAVGGVATLGVGLFFFGNAKNRDVDNRELYITITSDEEARVLKVLPTLGQEARQFAAAVHMAAQRLGNTA